jgi:hypothetical protein
MAQIDVLALMGEDALANHFQVVLPNFDKLGVATANLNMRILTVDIPDKTIGTYEITKRGRKFTRPNGVSEQELQISFTFRADKYWQCYNSINNWMNFVQNNETMAMGSDSGVLGVGGKSQIRADFEIWSLTNLDQGIPNNVWTCKGAYPTSLSGVSFDEESGDPLTVDVTLDCMNIIYPSM